MITAPVVSSESAQAFRQKNGLQVYVPPGWFLEGNFIACEKNPSYVFGPVQDFGGVLGGTLDSNGSLAPPPPPPASRHPVAYKKLTQLSVPKKEVVEAMNLKIVIFVTMETRFITLKFLIAANFLLKFIKHSSSMTDLYLRDTLILKVLL